MIVVSAQELYIGGGIVYHGDGLVADRRDDWSVYNDLDLAVDLRRESCSISGDDRYMYARLLCAAELEDQLMSHWAQSDLTEALLESIVDTWLMTRPEHRVYRRSLIECQREWVCEPQD